MRFHYVSLCDVYAVSIETWGRCGRNWRVSGKQYTILLLYTQPT